MRTSLWCRHGFLRHVQRAQHRRTGRLPTYVTVTNDVSAPGPEREARIAANQLRTASALLQLLAPHVATDLNLPTRVKEIAGDRRFNSSTRRLYRELLFTYVRFWPWLTGLDSDTAAECAALLAPVTPEVLRLRQSASALQKHALSFCTGYEEARSALQDKTGNSLCSVIDLVTPPWLKLSGLPAPPEVATTRPPLSIRIYKRHLLRNIEADALALGARLEPTVIADAFRVCPEVPGTHVDITSTASFAAGAFEVQDLGSQMLLEAVAPDAGGRWLDACAGAGGKSLQLATMLGPTGSVHAEDVRLKALDQLAMRAERCGLSDRITRAPSPVEAAVPPALYDGVLVDAPCTGSGTWRRSPHLRWRITPELVQDMAAKQLALLRRHAVRVTPGGLLVYATCSQAFAENEGVVDEFLSCEGHAFEPADLPGTVWAVQETRGRLIVGPSQYNTDAFFVAVLRRRR